MYVLTDYWIDGYAEGDGGPLPPSDLFIDENFRNSDSDREWDNTL